MTCGDPSIISKIPVWGVSGLQTLERSGDRKPTVRVTVGTTVILSQTPNVKIWRRVAKTKIFHDRHHASWAACVGGVIHRNQFYI